MSPYPPPAPGNPAGGPPAPPARIRRNPTPRPLPHLRAAPPAAPIDPETLALMEPAEAQAAVAALCPAQRAAQARAQAAWLSDFGYPVAAEELLASWEFSHAGAAPCTRRGGQPPRPPLGGFAPQTPESDPAVC